MSSTIRPARVGIPACASISRFTAINPRRFSPRVNRSVSNQCRVEVSAAPRSQRFGDPMRRKVGSADTRDRVVEVFVAREPTVDRLPQEIHQAELRQPLSGVGCSAMSAKPESNSRE